MTNLNLMFLFFFHFLRSYVPDSECHKQVARAVSYMHQTSGACAGLCACDRTHEMEETVLDQENMYLFVYNMDILLGYPKQNTL